MHQEMHYPGRTVGTDLANPDFAALARAYGGHGEVVERTEQFAAAFARALESRQAGADRNPPRSRGHHPGAQLERGSRAGGGPQRGVTIDAATPTGLFAANAAPDDVPGTPQQIAQPGDQHDAAERVDVWLEHRHIP